MIQLIDNTLTAFDKCLPTKEELHVFCELLFAIGVDIVELSVDAYKKMEYLIPNHKFALHIEYPELALKFPGFYRYISHSKEVKDKLINEVQINDAREIVRLKDYYKCSEVRIVGLDDLLCKSFHKTMIELQNSLPNSKINFYPENTYHCASALAVQWIIMGASNITTSFAGYKNNAATEEVIMALRLSLRHKPNRDLSMLPTLTKLFEKIANTNIGNKKPVIGKDIFKVESGIHADGMRKNPANYEAYSPKCVGRKAELVIGKHSGMKAIQYKLVDLQIPLQKESVMEKVLYLVKETCDKKKSSLKDEEFVELVNEVIANERNQIYS